MFPIESALTIDKKLPTPVYLQIANGIIAYIRQGALKPGAPLPSSRALAVALRVHRKTVIAAYEELAAQSWIESYLRKGVAVAKNLPVVKARALSETMQRHSLAAETPYPISHKRFASRLFKKAPERNLVCNDGFPDTRIAPVELLIREYRRFANYRFTATYLMYGPEQGSLNLRREMAKFLAETRGLEVKAADILITKGAQMAMFLVAQVLLDAGDIVVVGDPGYSGANEVFLQAGARLELVPVDSSGIDLDAVEKLCRKKKIRLLYVIPHHHTPTTVTLSSERRMRLLELAGKYGFAILEDDYDFDFQYSSSPILPLASADYTGNVIYAGSFCKTIAPGIRIGFMVAPANFLEQAARLRKLIDRQGEQLLEEALANLLKNGDIHRHLKKANKLYRERRDLMCSLLEGQLADYITFKVPDGGFAVWITYQKGLDPAAVAEAAGKLGLTINDGSDYYHDPSVVHHSIRMGFASLNTKEIREVVGLLAQAVKAVSVAEAAKAAKRKNAG